MKKKKNLCFFFENNFKLSLERNYLSFVPYPADAASCYMDLLGKLKGCYCSTLLQGKLTPSLTNKIKGFQNFIATPSVPGWFPSLTRRYLPELLHATENGRINFQIE